MMTLEASVASERGTDTAAAWNQEVLALGGHLLQSWEWGEFKSLHGWEAERIMVGEGSGAAAAQVLYRSRGPFRIAYIPRGPAFADDGARGLRELFAAIDAACRRQGVAVLIVEPDRELPLGCQPGDLSFRPGPQHYQPSRTVKVPLLDDAALLAQMHQKTRYSVRLAERRGVEVRRADPTASAVDCFYALLSETATRNEFGIHEKAYYRDFLHVLRERALLLFAFVEERPAAALIAARFGPEAIYMYGASSKELRAHGAAFALQFEAMRWARSQGSACYDLWGIPAEDPEPAPSEGGRVPSSKGDDWTGLHKFKIGFGGMIQTYPPSLERRYRPVMSYLVKWMQSGRGA